MFWQLLPQLSPLGLCSAENLISADQQQSTVCTVVLISSGVIWGRSVQVSSCSTQRACKAFCAGGSVLLLQVWILCEVKQCLCVFYCSDLPSVRVSGKNQYQSQLNWTACGWDLQHHPAATCWFSVHSPLKRDCVWFRKFYSYTVPLLLNLNEHRATEKTFCQFLLNFN